MQNPLLNQEQLPKFSDILPEYIEPALQAVLQQNRQTLTDILKKEKKFTWDNLMAPLETLSDRITKLWAPISHMHAVKEEENLRKVYHHCLPLLTEYNTELMQNQALYQAIKSIEESPEYAELNPVQRKVIENELRDFRLGGVHLPEGAKLRLGELQKNLSKLSMKFSENLLDATHAWVLHVQDAKKLSGLTEQTLQIAKQNAEERGLSGWVFTLDFPSYSSVMKYLADRDLRRQMYAAYVTRASDKGPNAGKWDNTQVMEDIVRTRHEIAKILGFANYAEYSLATKMAKNPERVLSFLNDLVARSKPIAEKEMQELAAFAKVNDGIENIAAWDWPYYTEKLRQHKFDLSQEDLRPYFPIDKVLSGMFTVVNKLFAIRIVERKEVDIWQPHVQFFEIRDRNNQLRGYFYTDFYARPHKREGAWMDECRTRRHLVDGGTQLPVAFLTCNFQRPVDDKPALLTHEDVLTLFHEFGHCLHHLLTQVDYAFVAGINGVPWDAVEFPSQFLELWCWEKEIMPLISGHIDSGEVLPDALYEKMANAKNFQPGMHMLRQLEFSLFDFCLHLEFDSDKKMQVQAALNAIREKASVVHVPEFNRFQHGFSHIFAGSYAAGYYSYKWAEVLSSDAFSRFSEEGILNHVVGESFMKNILEKGGSQDPLELFVNFRGREPKIDALLQHSGL